ANAAPEVRAAPAPRARSRALSQPVAPGQRGLLDDIAPAELDQVRHLHAASISRRRFPRNSPAMSVSSATTMSTRARTTDRRAGGGIVSFMCATLAGCTPSLQKEAPAAPSAAPTRVFPRSPLVPLPSGIATLDGVACAFRTKGTFHVNDPVDGVHEPAR